jgi:hypothetical protein
MAPRRRSFNRVIARTPHGEGEPAMSKKGGNKTKTAPKPPMANKGPKQKG